MASFDPQKLTVDGRVSNKKKKCKDGCELPADQTCTFIAGTQEDAEWVQCYRERSAPAHEICCNLCDGPTDCKLSEEDEKDIKEQCEKLPTMEEKMKCAYEHIADRLGEDGVCRHHADCVEDIYDELGIPTDFEVGCTSLFNCHAWIETVDADGCTTITDTYNSIMFKCCPKK